MIKNERGMIKRSEVW